MSHRAASTRQIPVSDLTAGPYAITTGPDNALWFTMVHSGEIGRFAADGRLDRYQLDSASCGPAGDDALWFVEIGAGQIGRISTDGRVEEFALPDRACRPHAITADLASRVCWFTEWATGRIGSITPDGHIEEYDLPDPSSEPHGLTLGPDGALYVALEIGAIARLEPS
jgi:virginiamycin B lyase